MKPENQQEMLKNFIKGMRSWGYQDWYIGGKLADLFRVLHTMEEDGKNVA